MGSQVILLKSVVMVLLSIATNITVFVYSEMIPIGIFQEWDLPIRAIML